MSVCLLRLFVALFLPPTILSQHFFGGKEEGSKGEYGKMNNFFFLISAVKF